LQILNARKTCTCSLIIFLPVNLPLCKLIAWKEASVQQYAPICCTRSAKVVNFSDSMSSGRYNWPLHHKQGSAAACGNVMQQINANAACLIPYIKTCESRLGMASFRARSNSSRCPCFGMGEKASVFGSPSSQVLELRKVLIRFKARDGI